MNVNSKNNSNILAVIILFFVMLFTFSIGYTWHWNILLILMIVNISGVVIAMMVLNQKKYMWLSLVVFFVAVFGYNTYLDQEIHYIYNYEDLLDIDSGSKGHYQLEADIIIEDHLAPSISLLNNFNGELDGNGYTISKLGGPLFYSVDDAYIHDITFDVDNEYHQLSIIAEHSYNSTFDEIQVFSNGLNYLFGVSSYDSFSNIVIDVDQVTTSDGYQFLFADTLKIDDDDIVFDNIIVTGNVISDYHFSVFGNVVDVDRGSLNTITFSNIVVDLSIEADSYSFIGNISSGNENEYYILNSFIHFKDQSLESSFTGLFNKKYTTGVSTYLYSNTVLAIEDSLNELFPRVQNCETLFGLDEEGNYEYIIDRLLLTKYDNTILTDVPNSENIVMNEDMFSNLSLWDNYTPDIRGIDSSNHLFVVSTNRFERYILLD